MASIMICGAAGLLAMTLSGGGLLWLGAHRPLIALSILLGGGLVYAAVRILWFAWVLEEWC